MARLAALTAGTSADNERRMRLESYVLAARLEQVAAAATVRLQRMSSGRYTLVHSDDRTGRGRSGLGLHVVDAWTGRERDTATLSGGETFFASLALALGLADVVTDEAGGVRLDTLFHRRGLRQPGRPDPSTRSWTSWTPCANATAASASSATSPTCAAASTPNSK
ncbi:hypothetical protein LT493_19370 [Streptomyces tricolor]|nr:hypothetical protein [Streptomyces tricolor]